MHPVALAGVVCTGLALVGYVLGQVAAYPGRAVTLTGLMVGTALLLVGLAAEGSP
ncbi:hypothetical protein [Halorarius halobius]|uniref:hypothetical protein n=1 Tax=Halorarius halobius TaxID=2962671 RepID=UPI0020CE8A75|nr:hypothetical protein [Halorarius halobius]